MCCRLPAARGCPRMPGAREAEGAQESKRRQQWTFVTNSAAGKSPGAQVTWKLKRLQPPSAGPQTHNGRGSGGPWPRACTVPQFLPGQGRAVPAAPVQKSRWGGVQGPRQNGRTQLLRGVSPRQGHPRKSTLPLFTPFWAGVPEQSGAARPEAGPQGTLEQQGRAVPTWPPFSPGGPSLPGCPCQEREGLR